MIRGFLLRQSMDRQLLRQMFVKKLLSFVVSSQKSKITVSRQNEN